MIPVGKVCNPNIELSRKQQPSTRVLCIPAHPCRTKVQNQKRRAPSLLLSQVSPTQCELITEGETNTRARAAQYGQDGLNWRTAAGWIFQRERSSCPTELLSSPWPVWDREDRKRKFLNGFSQTLSDLPAAIRARGIRACSVSRVKRSRSHG